MTMSEHQGLVQIKLNFPKPVKQCVKSITIREEREEGGEKGWDVVPDALLPSHDILTQSH